MFLHKKIKRLAIPYVCFSLLALGLKIVFSTFTRSGVNLVSSLYGIILEGKYFWFLYVMFFILVTIELLKILRMKTVYIWMIAMAFYLFGLFTSTTFLCLNMFGYYFLFTLIGMLVCKYKNMLDKKLSKWYVVTTIIIMFAEVYSIDSNMLLVKEFRRFLLAVAGTALTYSASLSIKKHCFKISSLLSYFGVMSLPYYLVHMIIQLPIYYLVAKIDIPVPVLSVFAIFLITILCTCIMVNAMLRIHFCRYCMGMNVSNTNK